jgi:hypothetical protein
MSTGYLLINIKCALGPPYVGWAVSHKILCADSNIFKAIYQPLTLVEHFKSFGGKIGEKMSIFFTFFFTEKMSAFFETFSSLF